MDTTNATAQPRPGQRIAVIGSGISGLISAYLLSRRYSVTLFEARDRLGGHAHTVDLDAEGRAVPVDTGFIVFNDRTYPTFCRLVDQLGVPWQEAPMNFGVRSDRTGLEYAMTSIDSLFAQRRNLVRLGYLRLLVDVVRWNRLATRSRGQRWASVTLGEFLSQHNFSQAFVQEFLNPLGSAIWSCPAAQFAEFPVGFLTSFFHNHGMLSWADHPQWRTIVGGSRQYIQRITAAWQATVELRTPIQRIQRSAAGVAVTTTAGATHHFDHVVIATHGDQALRMLADPSPLEQKLLSTFAYQANVATLHTDTGVLPHSHKAWAAWNYRVQKREHAAVTLTYDMNHLQSLPLKHTRALVTVNGEQTIDHRSRHGQWTYHHPLFTVDSAAAQRQHKALINHNRTSYCGAYWGYGFHEDGAASACRVAEAFGEQL